MLGCLWGLNTVVSWAVMAHTFDPSTQEAEAGGPGVQVLYNKFKASFRYMRNKQTKIILLQKVSPKDFQF